jgi:ribosomal protein S18 acetylase RimI-like enzyme
MAGEAKPRRGGRRRPPVAAAIEVRRVELFDEAALAALTEPIFGDAARQQYFESLDGPEITARQKALRASLPKPERIRVGAFDGERLVGASSGWFERGTSFYIGMSAVDPAYRRQGLYTRLLNEMEQAVRERGGATISSNHVATNNAVLIAKLKLGYVISGLEFLESMGLLVRLVLYLTPERQALFALRSGTLRPPAT